MADTYTTRDLANALIGKDDKGATREVRKFLRADTVARGGKVGTDTPGKGGRYTLEFTKRDLNALKKKFIAWQAEQAEAKKARAAALADAMKAKAEEATIEAETDETPEPAIELETPEEPKPDDFDAMVAEVLEGDEDLEGLEEL